MTDIAQKIKIVNDVKNFKLGYFSITINGVMALSFFILHVGNIIVQKVSIFSLDGMILYLFMPLMTGLFCFFQLHEILLAYRLIEYISIEPSGRFTYQRKGIFKHMPRYVDFDADDKIQIIINSRSVVEKSYWRRGIFRKAGTFRISIKESNFDIGHSINSIQEEELKKQLENMFSTFSYTINYNNKYPIASF